MNEGLGFREVRDEHVLLRCKCIEGHLVDVLMLGSQDTPNRFTVRVKTNHVNTYVDCCYIITQGL